MSQFMSAIDQQFGVGQPAPVQPPPPPVAAQAPAFPPPLPPIQGAAGRPAHWLPGDPLNDTQKYLQAAGAPITMIAAAADRPPSAEVIATFGAAPAPVPSFGASAPAAGARTAPSSPAPASASRTAPSSAASPPASAAASHAAPAPPRVIVGGVQGAARP
jgi:hypothetical protein